MCGVAAVISTEPDDLAPIGEMTQSMTHRGPDDWGVSSDAKQGVALGMRRLAVVDLVGGHQPMTDEHGQVELVFNGEIYNHVALRRQLEAKGVRFQTEHSDTEVLVHGFRLWGPSLFARLNGMFALVLLDRRSGEVHVARDRFGEKPLYLARIPSGWVIASEIKALLKHPKVDRVLDLEGLHQYLGFDYILSPRSIWQGISKLPAGHHGTIRGGRLDTAPFWSPDYRIAAMSTDEAAAELDARLAEAVRLRMAADVPVGLFLSGGLDSSTVGYYMTRLAGSRVKSFSVGFEQQLFDESAHGRQVAKHLGTEHHEEVFSGARVLDLVRRVPEVLDEPMGDQSILPTMLVSMVARQSVTVALGGDGSDELLMGYGSFRALKAAWTLARAPLPMRRAAGSLAQLYQGNEGRKRRLEELASRLNASPTERLMRVLGAFGGDASAVLACPPDGWDQRVAELAGLVRSERPSPDGAADETVLAYLRTYLQEDILPKVDRASMATSLEVRVPFLDVDVADFALALPPNLRLRGITGKYLLRHLMSSRLPPEILRRRKMGFGAPVGQWLRHEMRDWATGLLDPVRLKEQGLFDADAVGALWSRHVSGVADESRQLWLILQFQQWCDRWNPSIPS